MMPPATFTASGTSSPASASRTDFATETPAFSCASSVDAPRCGVTMTFGSESSGDSRGGSETNTSRPAPAIAAGGERLVQRILVDEAAAGDVHDVRPWASSSRAARSQIMPVVSGVFGMWIVMKSLRSSSSSRLTVCTPSCCARAAVM